MTANAIVNGIGLLWLAMMVLSITIPVYIAVTYPEQEREGWMIIWAILFQAYAVVPAIVVTILRLVLEKRISGMGRWFGFVPGTVSGVVLLLGGIAGHLVGE